MKLSDINPNPDNPRVIKDAKFRKLVNSIREFPKMLELRPMVLDTTNTLIGGNMRFRALQHLGYTEIPDTWVKRAEDLSEDEKKRFIVADNIQLGDWDWDVLSNLWNEDDLIDWGLTIEAAQKEADPEVAEEQRTVEDMELKFNEHHDYIVFLFNNVNDYVMAVTNLGLKKVKATLSEKAKKVGLGRVVDGTRLIELMQQIQNQKYHAAEESHPVEG
ncbi:MAG: ParB N-terminal domain-containing protein [Chlorobiaceae bacterium]|nr:ParB N-terminal domain-containing protein [Chlorobiaceae bacterium]